MTLHTRLHKEVEGVQFKMSLCKDLDVAHSNEIIQNLIFNNIQFFTFIQGNIINMLISLFI